MEYTTIIIETADLITKGFLPALAALSPTAISGIAAAIPGIAKGIGSLFGGGKRRREEKRANKQRGRALRQFESMQFTNPFGDMTNPYADLENQFEDDRVGLQAAEFTAQEQQQQLANVLDAYRGSAGGSGGAAVATALAKQASRNTQMAAANIEQQELANQRAASQAGMELDMVSAGGEQKRQIYRGEGESSRQQLEMGKRSQILGLANQELAGAKMARAQAKSDLIGGIGSVAGAAFSAGDFGKKSGIDWDTKFKELGTVSGISDWKSKLDLGTFQGFTLPTGNASRVNQSRSLSNINPLTGLPYKGV